MTRPNRIVVEGVDIADLRSGGRTEELVRARELLMILGVERFGLRVPT